jgi:hypothetical protein
MEATVIAGDATKAVTIRITNTYIPPEMQTAWARMQDEPSGYDYIFDGHVWFSYLMVEPTAYIQTFYFYAAQAHRVGEVDIWVENGYLHIEIRMDQGFALAEATKVNVQTSLNDYSNPAWAPGQYPLTGNSSFSIAWLDAWNDEILYIAIHGVVSGDF